METSLSHLLSKCGLSVFSETDRFRTQQRSPETDPPRFLDRLDSRLDPYPVAYDSYEEQDTRRPEGEIEKVWISVLEK